MSGAVDVPRSSTSSNLSQPINLAGAARPERDAALVGDVLRGFCDAEKLGSDVVAGALELQPPLDSDVASEPKCGQERLVEQSRLGKAAYPEVDVMVAPLRSGNG